MNLDFKNKINTAFVAFQKWISTLQHKRQDQLIRNFEDLIVDSCSSQDESCKTSGCARFNKPDVQVQEAPSKVFPIFQVQENKTSSEAQAIQDIITHLQDVLNTASESDLMFLKDNVLRMNSNAKRMRDMVRNIQTARG